MTPSMPAEQLPLPASESERHGADPPGTPWWRSEVHRSWKGSWELPGLLLEPVSEDDRLALVALAMSGLGPGGLARDLRDAGSARALLAASEPSVDLGQARERLARSGARAVVPSDEEYPELLRHIDAPPPLLFVIGHPLASLQPAVGIVGARVCTPGGTRFAGQLAECLSRCDVTVVSGMARGIDAAAHTGALLSGRTVAVLGTGIDIVYPAEHRRLYRQISEQGSVVTEFPPGVRPRAWHFPARNRIIAGLSVAVVVVEAGERSGALITAGFALEQGREVLACTVSPTTPSGAGVRALMREGAGIVIDADHLRELVGEIAGRFGFKIEDRPPAATLPPELTEDGLIVYEAVLEQTTVDELVERTGMTSWKVSSVLTALELEGVIADDGGGRWRRVR